MITKRSIILGSSWRGSERASEAVVPRRAQQRQTAATTTRIERGHDQRTGIFGRCVPAFGPWALAEGDGWNGWEWLAIIIYTRAAPPLYPPHRRTPLSSLSLPFHLPPCANHQHQPPPPPSRPRRLCAHRTRETRGRPGPIRTTRRRRSQLAASGLTTFSLARAWSSSSRPRAKSSS
jgi:hypothetical protein